LAHWHFSLFAAEVKILRSPMGYAPVPPTDYNQQQLYPQQTYYAEAPSPAQSPSPVPFYAAQEGYYGPHVAKAPVVPPVELSADEVGHPVELSASPTRRE
jgi:hypothetical protein